MNNTDLTIGVYTQGKVATKTMRATLEAALPNQRVWDFRRATLGGVQEHETMAPGRELRSDDRRFYEFLQGRIDLDMRFISLVRDPVGTAVSSYFYNYANLHDGDPVTAVGFAEIRRAIEAGDAYHRPDFGISWPDIEVKVFTGIDIYASAPSFPHEIGYSWHQGANEHGEISLAIIRLEDIPQGTFQPALQRLLGVEVAAMAPAINTAVDEGYGDHYDSFRASPGLSLEYVDSQLESRYGRWCYSAGERAELRRKWTATA